MPLLTNALGDILGFAVLRFVVLPGDGVNLAGSLVPGQVELFLDFTLAAAQPLVALLVLEGGADLGFEFLASFMRIGDVVFEPGGALLEALDSCLQRADCAQRGVRDP